jgi:hypothetical protein
MTPPDWILWMSAHFSPEQYLFWTRWQCLAWTAADLLIVFFVIRLSNQARKFAQRRPHRFSYAVLAFTALLLPFVVLSPSGGLLFLLELVITIPHFLLLCYLLTVNIGVYAEFVSALVEGARNPGTERQVL